MPTSELPSLQLPCNVGHFILLLFSPTPTPTPLYSSQGCHFSVTFAFSEEDRDDAEIIILDYESFILMMSATMEHDRLRLRCCTTNFLNNICSRRLSRCRPPQQWPWLKVWCSTRKIFGSQLSPKILLSTNMTLAFGNFCYYNVLSRGAVAKSVERRGVLQSQSLVHLYWQPYGHGFEPRVRPSFSVITPRHRSHEKIPAA